MLFVLIHQNLLSPDDIFFYGKIHSLFQSRMTGIPFPSPSTRRGNLRLEAQRKAPFMMAATAGFSLLRNGDGWWRPIGSLDVHKRKLSSLLEPCVEVLN